MIDFYVAVVLHLQSVATPFSQPKIQDPHTLLNHIHIWHFHLVSAVSQTPYLDLNGLIEHELEHQVRERPIRFHELSLGTDEAVGQAPHTAKEPIFKDPRCPVHPIGQLGRET